MHYYTWQNSPSIGDHFNIAICVWLSARADHVVLLCALAQAGYMAQNIAYFTHSSTYFFFFLYKLQNTGIFLNACYKIRGLFVYKYILICVNAESKLFTFVVVLPSIKCKEKQAPSKT